ncbi:MAG: type II secretion system protein GspM [Rhodocyclaceae bacterium]
MTGPITRLNNALASRSPRERRMILVAILVVTGATLVWLAEWTMTRQARLAWELPEARAQLARMQDDAAELLRLQRLTAPATPPMDTLAQAASAAGASRGLSLEVETLGNSLRVEGSGPFNAVTDWFASLQADQRLRASSVTMEAGEHSVRFQATLTLP